MLSYNGLQYNKKPARVSLRQRQKLNDDIDGKLDSLLRKHTNREFSDMNLAIQCGRAIKMNHVKM
jgi:hypothetical protein